MKPLVSVKTITYNHEPYIRQCIEGVLMQKTDFPIEYVIGEDCSTDGTREIVAAYAQQYPDVIRLITSDRNVGARQNALRTSRDLLRRIRSRLRRRRLFDRSIGASKAGRLPGKPY